MNPTRLLASLLALALTAVATAQKLTTPIDVTERGCCPRPAAGAVACCPQMHATARACVKLRRGQGIRGRARRAMLAGDHRAMRATPRQREP